MTTTNELGQLVADLNKVAEQSPHKAQQVVQQTGINTKAFWRVAAAGNPGHSRYTATIDYELTGSIVGGDLSLEVGPNLARYGGKTGHGGLVPSFGIFDDPLSQGTIRRPPDRARRKAEKFAADDTEKGLSIAIDQIMRAAGL